MHDTSGVKKPPIDLTRLTIDQKLDLMEKLWESLDKDGLPPLSQAERNELDRRLAEHRRGDVPGIPWEEARRRIKASLRRRKR